jgi:uncharacterized membrane protein YdjX (TVP38/TMEM64 family)
MKKEYRKYVLIGAAILISVLIFIFRRQLVYLQNLGYLGVFLISVIGNATIILPVPALLTAFVGGAFLNPLLVAVISSFGATIGELTGYMAGVGGKEFVKNDPRIKKVEKWMKKYGMWTIFVLAVIPNPAFDLAGMVSGATRIPVWKYFIVTWAGKFIKFWLVSQAGAISSKSIFN